MVHVKASLVALSALVSQAYAAAASVNTPTSLIQCQPYQLTWTEGEGGPYFLSVLPGGQASGTPIEQLGTFQEGTNSFTWTVNVPSGTSVTIQIVDKSGQPNYADQVTVLAGSDSCDLVKVDGSDASVVAASGSAGGATSAASGASSSAGGGLNTPRTTPGASATSAGASAASSASSAGSSAASSAAPSGSSAPASGANKVALSGLAVLGAAALAIVA
ncbi:hypothetical protein BCR35DRAFT_305945 [Leucosporidium creatinivorum]|uniref:Yeast cell wall synthesis Kre9/Knh1-like N-terminal domain-containing protein n=1 Tax=Leucosporidium creatinivorum TaxID=106004 RepID=A0A1Y2EXD9_9BASI|nr:hypothetical protein BCR35DRAFT_305945 [Leucosporidium creatinivorum]